MFVEGRADLRTEDPGRYLAPPAFEDHVGDALPGEFRMYGDAGNVGRRLGYTGAVVGSCLDTRFVSFAIRATARPVGMELGFDTMTRVGAYC